MRRLFPVAGLLAAVILLQGCGPTYTRDRIPEALKELVREECSFDCEPKLVGGTLYLRIALPGLVTSESDGLAQLFKKIESAYLAATRVALSSDAGIDVIAVTAQDPSWGLTMRLIRRMDDIKSFYYQRISKSDFEGRYILEIENGNVDTMPDFRREDHPVGSREFIGRLIVSQVNMLSRSNPFLGAMIGNASLRYAGFTEDEILIRMEDSVDEELVPLLERIVKTQSESILGKYKEWYPDRVTVRVRGGRSLTVPLYDEQ